MENLRTIFTIVLFSAPCAFGWLAEGQYEQTKLLTRIAIADEKIVEQTRTPVSIKIDGFSPAAQQVFNAAVKPKQKGK